MVEVTRNTAPEADDIDPALVEAMRSRVVKRKPQDYGKRKAGPGRPKGYPKTGGKKAGTPNLMSPEFRVWLLERAKPFELLASVCAGEEIEDKDGRRKPTMQERMRAAETISRKLLPDLRATELTGAEGGPVAVQGVVNGLPDGNAELVRRVMFMLTKSFHEMDSRADTPEPVNQPPQMVLPTPKAVASDLPQDTDAQGGGASRPTFQPGDTKQIGRTTISFAERLPGDRERWAIRDETGKLVGAAFGQEDAEFKARAISEEMK